MSRFKRIMKLAVLAVLILSALCVPALALDESEVEAAVAASSKEAVTGNVLIWFLCAVAFLKVSQKIDSFMASLGVNVGRTGGSMLAESLAVGGAALGPPHRAVLLEVVPALPGLPDSSRAA